LSAALSISEEHPDPARDAATNSMAQASLLACTSMVICRSFELTVKHYACAVPCQGGDCRSVAAGPVWLGWIFGESRWLRPGEALSLVVPALARLEHRSFPRYARFDPNERCDANPGASK